MICLSNHQFEELQAHYAAVQTHLDAIHAIIIKAKQQTNNNTFDVSAMYPNRPMSKKELATMLHVSSRHLASQIKLLRPELHKLGVSDRAKLLPPKAVFEICSAMDIEKNNGENCKKLHDPK